MSLRPYFTTNGKRPSVIAVWTAPRVTPNSSDTCGAVSKSSSTTIIIPKEVVIVTPLLLDGSSGYSGDELLLEKQKGQDEGESRQQAARHQLAVGRALLAVQQINEDREREQIGCSQHDECP